MHRKVRQLSSFGAGRRSERRLPLWGAPEWRTTVEEMTRRRITLAIFEASPLVIGESARLGAVGK